LRCWGAIVLAVGVLLATSSWAQGISGAARVIDGDTLAVGADRVRLFGIDAPERGQPCHDGGDCGAAATAFLVNLIDGRAVRCVQEDVDQYGRVVATCFVGATDLNRAMVRAGHAVPYLAFSRRYAGDTVASPRFAAPAAYRRAGRNERRASESAAETLAAPAPGDCAIKGNVSSRGVRIYHLPGSRSYAATRIDTARGERWFCSVAEAEAAGWRAPRR
jgi:endonuclease YncB( thermonuclease family)